MGRASRRYGARLAALALVFILWLVVPADSQDRPAPDSVIATLQTRADGPAIPAGFVGLSFEYSAIPGYAGTDPNRVDPVLEQLIRNLTPGQSPVLRIGGDSTDHTWYPVPGMHPSKGIQYTITRNWLAVTKSLAQALQAKLILGINWEANSRRIADGEANAFVKDIGASSIRALELGNEPELYGSFAWYQASPGHPVRGRPWSYDLADYTREFSALAKTLPAHVALAGPATGGRTWIAKLPEFAKAERGRSLLTVHRYALRGCHVTRSSPQYATIPNLLTTGASEGLARSIAPYMRLGTPARIDELNSVTCGGVSGVSNTFASALWAVNTLFELARVGASGVNFHTFPGARYAPFAFTEKGGTWSASVTPLYYGLLLFAQAAPPGSRLLSESEHGDGWVRVWPVRTPQGQIRVTIVNTSATRGATVAVRVPGSDASGSSAPGSGAPATVSRLEAPGLTARGGVTLAGLGFGTPTTSGVPAGSPRTTTVRAAEGAYRVQVPAASAALVTISG